MKIAQSLAVFDHLSIAANELNPQPLPPSPPPDSRHGGVINPLDLVAINPQPLPPRELSQLFTGLRPGATNSLNPQPLPPGPPDPDTFTVFSPGARVSLNPQPLPPRILHDIGNQVFHVFRATDVATSDWLTRALSKATP